MKRLVLVLLVMVSFAFASKDVNFYHDFESGAKAAKKEKKMMMIMLHIKGCPECAYMKDVVFKQPETAKFISENFVNISLDIKDDYVPAAYTQIGVPTFYFTDPNGNVVHKQIGAVRGNKFLQVVQTAKSKYK